MVHRRAPVRGVNSEPAEEDRLAEAIDDVLHELQAAQRDLHLTGFFLRQVESIRRIDRAKASFTDLVESRNRGNNNAA